MTLIAVTNSEGTRRCDERCYEAEGGVCTCVCGGMNHGRGLRQARDNTALCAGKLLADLREKGVDCSALEIPLEVLSGQETFEFMED